MKDVLTVWKVSVTGNRMKPIKASEIQDNDLIDYNGTIYRAVKQEGCEGCSSLNSCEICIPLCTASHSFFKFVKVSLNSIKEDKKMVKNVIKIKKPVIERQSKFINGDTVQIDFDYEKLPARIQMLINHRMRNCIGFTSKVIATAFSKEHGSLFLVEGNNRWWSEACLKAVKANNEIIMDAIKSVCMTTGYTVKFDRNGHVVIYSPISNKPGIAMVIDIISAANGKGEPVKSIVSKAIGNPNTKLESGKITIVP